MKHVPLAVSMAFVSPPSSSSSSSSSSPLPPSTTTSTRLLLDPTQDEEKAAAALATLTIGSVNGNLLSASTLGVMSPTQLFEAMEVARGTSKALLAFVRMSVEEHSRRTLTVN